MKTIHQKLTDVELEVQNLTMFITQCTTTLKCKILEQANIYANFQG